MLLSLRMWIKRFPGWMRRHPAMMILLTVIGTLLAGAGVVMYQYILFLETTTAPVYSICWLPDGKQIVSAHADGSIELTKIGPYDEIIKRILVARPKGRWYQSDETPYLMEYGPEGTLVCSNPIRVVSFDKGATTINKLEHIPILRSIAWNRSKSEIIACAPQSYNIKVTIWNATTTKLVSNYMITLAEHVSEYYSGELSPGGEILVLRGRTHERYEFTELRLLKDNRTLAFFTLNANGKIKERLSGLCFNPDNSKVALIYATPGPNPVEVRIYNLQTQQTERTIPVPKSMLWSPGKLYMGRTYASWSADGKRIGIIFDSATADKLVFCCSWWSTDNGDLLATSEVNKFTEIRLFSGLPGAPFGLVLFRTDTFMPVWSPDLNYIAFIRRSSSIYSLYDRWAGRYPEGGGYGSVLIEKAPPAAFVPEN